MMKLLSNQVSEQEIAVIRRELQAVLKQKISGDIVEFGCYVGTTSVFLLEAARTSTKRVWLYDSFEGLPVKTPEDVSPAGDQFRPGELYAPRKQLEKNLRDYPRSSYRIKKGWFSELTEQDVPGSICFAFLDGDYYESILAPLRLIWPHLAAGAVIVVDDYANEALPGAAKAVDEWAKRHGIRIRQEQSLAIFKK